MKQFKTHVLALALFCAATFSHAQTPVPAAPHAVVEVVTLKLKPGTSVETFRDIDQRIATEHVARQPGFVARESVPGANGTWLVIVHWRSTADAQASMNTFEKAPAAAAFMALVEPGSMKMTRYGE